MFPVVAFNLALLVVDVAWLALARQRGPWLRVLLLAAYATCAFALALLVLWLAGGRVWTFTLVQLVAWAFFAHGPLLGLTLAWLDGRSKTRSPWPASIFAFAIGAIAVWSFLVEPRRLEVTRTEVAASGVTRPVRVAVVADIQTDAPGDFERNALLAVKAAEPDLVLFTGDYVQERVPNRYFLAVDELNAILREVDLDPPLGAYAVRGDVDAHRVELWGRVFRGTRVVAIGTTPVSSSGRSTARTVARLSSSSRRASIRASACSSDTRPTTRWVCTTPTSSSPATPTAVRCRCPSSDRCSS
jgi:hypothetical protein